MIDKINILPDTETSYNQIHEIVDKTNKNFGIDNNTTKMYYLPNGYIDKIEEFDGETLVERTTITYLPNGDMAETITVTKNMTIVEKFNYINNNIESTTKTVTNVGL